MDAIKEQVRARALARMRGRRGGSLTPPEEALVNDVIDEVLAAVEERQSAKFRGADDEMDPNGARAEHQPASPTRPSK